MTQQKRTLIATKFAKAALPLLGLSATAFTGYRLSSAPSTLTFFVFEAALAATLGLLVSIRLARPEVSSSPATANDLPHENGDNTSASLSRLQSLATRLGLAPDGGLADLRKRIASEVSRDAERLSQIPADERAIAVALVPRTSTGESPVLNRKGDTSAAARRAMIAEDASALLSFSRDLQLTPTFYQKSLAKARRLSDEGRAEAALAVLADANSRLRTHLQREVADDFGSKHSVRSRRFYTGLTALFAFSTALTLLVLSRSLYVGPLGFYALVGIATCSVALNAHLAGEQRPNGVLLQIMVLAALVKFHFFYLNPYLYTSDSVFHFGGIQGISDSGYVPSDLGHYSFFPGYHAFGFAAASVVGLPLPWFGTFAFVANLAAVPIAYLIGREIAGPRTGLFSAILTVFSVFFFLYVIPLPSLFGFVFLFTALYAVIRLRGPMSQTWLFVFWLSALGAFFSHPITALVLLMALMVRVVQVRVLGRGAVESRWTAVPALSYAVVYAAYLAFIALVSFQLFVESFLGPGASGEPLATAPTQDLQITASYVLQSALAPSGVAILVFLAACGFFPPRGISAFERRFIVLLMIAFVLVPAAEVAAENFRTQSTRFLSYVAIPLALLGGHGVASLSRRLRTGWRFGGVVLPIVLVLAVVSPSSYLTTSDNRSLYGAIPAIPTHITDSALASRDFLDVHGGPTTVFMDFGSWHYFSNRARARDPLDMNILTLDQLSEPESGALVLLNEDLLAYGAVRIGGFYDLAQIQATLESSQAALIYDSGSVRIYAFP